MRSQAGARDRGDLSNNTLGHDDLIAAGRGSINQRTATTAAGRFPLRMPQHEFNIFGRQPVLGDLILLMVSPRSSFQMMNCLAMLRSRRALTSDYSEFSDWQAKQPEPSAARVVIQFSANPSPDRPESAFLIGRHANYGVDDACYFSISL